MVNNMVRAVPVTLQQAVQAGSIGSHGNIPSLPSVGIPVTSVNVPTNTGGLSRPGIGTRPIATPILAHGGLRNYPANPGIVIKPVGVRPAVPTIMPHLIHWGQT
jgi:hypothetical protein